jgi:branched-chain amino acid transport system substrate-binding protein
MKTIKIIISLILLITLVNAGCKKKESIYKAVQEEEIRIGALLALTGTGYSSGQSSQVALELAHQDINEYLANVENPVKVTLITADTKTDTAEALKQLKSMYEQGIRLVIGPYSSTEVLAIKNFADTHGMLIVSPSSVAVSLAIPNDNVFRFVSSDVIQGEAMNKMLVEDKIKVIAPLIRDDLWGKDLLAATRKNFVKNGGQVLDPVKFDPSLTDFSAVLTQLDTMVATELFHHNPNEVVVYMLSFAEGDKILGEAKKYAHLNNVYWYGGSAFAQNASVLNDTNAALFAYTHGLPCPVFGLDDAAKSKWQPLIERIREQIGRIPDVYAMTAYDALWVSVRTYLATGLSPDIELMKTVFTRESDSFFGASGNTLLDENGDRAYGNYDFWAVKHDLKGYCWKRVARYNSLTGLLTRVVE